GRVGGLGCRSRLAGGVLVLWSGRADRVRSLAGSAGRAAPLCRRAHGSLAGDHERRAGERRPRGRRGARAAVTRSGGGFAGFWRCDGATIATTVVVAEVI